jgi:hypothetical protein
MACSIVGAMSFNENVYDSHTHPDVLEQCWAITRVCPTDAICDRGYRGLEKVWDTDTHTTKPPKRRTRDTSASRRHSGSGAVRPSQARPAHGPLLPQDAVGDAINLFLVAAALNFKKWMQKVGYLFVLLTLFVRWQALQAWMARRWVFQARPLRDRPASRTRAWHHPCQNRKWATQVFSTCVAHFLKLGVSLHTDCTPSEAADTERTYS